MTKRHFVMRVSAGTELGIGHLVRCSHLANELQHRGHSVLLLVDQLDDRVQRWLRGVDSKNLYSSGAFANEADDAARCLTWVAGATVIVDDYRLSAQWEQIIAEKAEAIMVIDDLANRCHYCDWLVDQKWAGSVLTPQRYQELLIKDTRQLLGPDYCLLGPEYSCGLKRSATDSAGPFKILLSLGGGGDLNILARIIEQLLCSAGTKQLQLWPLIGPASINRQAVEQLAASYDNVQPIIGADSLYSAYCDADLYIGAAGTALYELNCVGLPAITFALADNQHNDRRALEDLGHYFHLSADEFVDTAALAAMVVDLLSHWSRVQRLCAEPAIQLDGKGIARVADSLLGIGADEAPLPLLQSSAVVQQAREGEGFSAELKPGVIMSAISDRDINRYLDSRNLPQNRQNMTEKQQIRRIDHYRWWFNNERNSFVLSRNGEKLLYIWHQLCELAGEHYLVGGWFVASEQCGFDIAALALKWQLAHCAELYPGMAWVAVIDKQNRFVNLLNQQVGFSALEPERAAFVAARAFFPQAGPESFNFVGYRP